MSLTIRRVVTGHDKNGKAVVKIDEISKNVISTRANQNSTVIWATRKWPIDLEEEIDMSAEVKKTTVDNGSVFRIVRFGPGGSREAVRLLQQQRADLQCPYRGGARLVAAGVHPPRPRLVAAAIPALPAAAAFSFACCTVRAPISSRSRAGPASSESSGESQTEISPKRSDASSEIQAAKRRPGASSCSSSTAPRCSANCARAPRNPAAPRHGAAPTPETPTAPPPAARGPGP